MTDMEIMAVVAEEYGITVEDMQQNNRKRHITEARGVYIWILRDYSPSKLGRLLNKDRSSIYHHLENMDFLTQNDRYVKRKYDAITNKLNTIMINMEFKMNIDQMEALIVFYRVATEKHTPINDAEKLLLSIVKEVYKKSILQFEKIEENPNAKPVIKISAVQSQGLKIWFQQLTNVLGNDSFPWERNQLTRLVHKIDQKHA